LNPNGAAEPISAEVDEIYGYEYGDEDYGAQQQQEVEFPEQLPAPVEKVAEEPAPEVEAAAEQPPEAEALELPEEVEE
jgi:hypothetical protein